MSATWWGFRGDSKEAKAKNGAGYQFRKGYKALSELSWQAGGQMLWGNLVESELSDIKAFTMAHSDLQSYFFVRVRTLASPRAPGEVW